jgi:hypothetical protein
MIYELKRTLARAAFKDLLGQANHFLITILVGLDGVRHGEVELRDEFRTSWNPKDQKRSAERSRIFALDLALIRAVDALDTYMMWSRREPCALSGAGFIAAVDGAGRSVAKRLSAFSEHLPSLDPEKLALLRLAVDWRNRRVHSLAEEGLDDEDLATVRAARNLVRSNYSGCDVEELIKSYRNGAPPSFKDAASLIKVTHDAVSHFDDKLLSQIEVEEYVRRLLRLKLSESSREAPDVALHQACGKVWDGTLKKEIKVLRALRFVGVHEVDLPTGRVLPWSFINRLTEMTGKEAEAFLIQEAG